jgi:hypothetical protein
MPLLSKHWSEGNFMTPGVHHVKVKAVKFITYNSGNKGIQYTVVNARHQELNIAFVLVEKALWKLATFVSALGWTKEQCATFDTERIGCHERLIGRQCAIEVIMKASQKDGKEYATAESWWRLETDTPEPTPEEQPQTVANEPPPAEEDIPF